MNLRKEFSAIIKIIEQARINAYTAVNVELINCYWQGFFRRRISNKIKGINNKIEGEKKIKKKK